MIQILLLEDSALDAELVGERLRRAGVAHESRRVASREEFDRAVREETYDVILADYSLSGFDGMAALEIARERASETPFIFVSATLGEEVAVEALKPAPPITS
jgi:CheY-like chemotaxis protein